MPRLDRKLPAVYHKPEAPAKGRIGVYSANHRLLDHTTYSSSRGMNTVMDRYYCSFPAGCYIQVSPYIDGSPEEKQAAKMKLPIVKEPEILTLKRPPAVYDNNKSLYGIDYEETHE